MRQMRRRSRAPCRDARDPWSRPACRPAPTARSIRATASGSVPGGGVRMHQRLAEQFGEARFRTGMLGAGDRMARDEMRRRPARAAPRSRITVPLTEPTSVTMAPALAAPARSAGRFLHRPTAASRSRRDRRPRPPAAGSSVVSSARSSRRTIAKVSARRAQATIAVAEARRAAARAPATIRSARSRSRRRARTRFSVGAHRPARIRQCRDHGLHLLAAADRDPQIFGQTVGAHLADQDAARPADRRRRHRHCGAGHPETAPARNCRRSASSRKPERGQALENHGRQRSLCARARSTAATSSTAATPAARAGALMLNGPRDAVQHVGDRRRAIGPAEAQPGERINLGEGAQHHDVRLPGRPVRRPGS